MQKLTRWDDAGLFAEVPPWRPPEELKLSWIKSHVSSKFINQPRLPFYRKQEPAPIAQIDFNHIPENQTELAYSVAVARNEGKPMRKGRRLTPSSAEVLVKDVLRHTTDFMYRPERVLDKDPIFTRDSLRGVVYHALAEIISNRLIQESPLPTPNHQRLYEQFIPSARTFLVKPKRKRRVELELQSYFPELGDGLNLSKALEILNNLNIHSPAEIGLRLAILQRLREQISKFKPALAEDIVDQKVEVPLDEWLALRDELYTDLDDVLVKMEMIFLMFDDLQKRYHYVEPIAIESNLIYHLGFTPPFMFEQLNPHSDIDRAHDMVKLLNQDLIILLPQTSFTPREYELNFQDGEKLIKGKIVIDGMGKIQIPDEIRKYMVGISSRGYVMEELSENNLDYRALLISPLKDRYSLEPSRIQHVLSLRQGDSIWENKNSGRVRYGRSGERFYFRNWHLQELGCQMVTKPDLALRVESETGEEGYHICDFKTNFHGMDSETQFISAGIYILNLALHIYSGKRGSLVSEAHINPNAFFYTSEDANKPLLGNIVNKITFFYIDLATGNSIPFKLTAADLPLLFSKLKYLVELGIVYPETISSLKSGVEIES